MPCKWLTPMAAWIVFGGLLISPCWANPEPSPAQALAELDSWLATSPHGAGWRRYLKLDELRAALTQDGAPDLIAAAASLRAFASDVPGLERRPFVHARQALEQWYAAQTAWPLEQIPQAIERAKDHFIPLTPQDVERRRWRVVSAMQAVERFLAQADTATQANWKAYLHWDGLRNAVGQRQAPSLDAIRASLARLNRPEVGLELEPFVALRQALRSYLNALLFQANPNPEQTYRAALEEVKSRVERYLMEPTTEAASQIAEGLAFLQDIGQAPHIVAAVRRRFDEPNLHITVSRDLLALGVERPVDEPTVVREVILGTHVRGYGRTRGRVRLSLAPSAEQAALVLHLDARAVTRNVGVNGPVTIYSTGATDIQAAHTVYLGDAGFRAGGVAAWACVRTHLTGIAARFRIVERIGWRQAIKSLPQAQAVASQRATQRAKGQFAEQVRRQLASPNENFRESYLAPLTRWQVMPELMRFSTTPERLLATIRHATERQLASPAPAPPEVGGDLAMRIHESAVGNFSESAVAGRTYGPEEIQRLWEQLPMGGELDPKQFQLDRDWSITFRDRHPVAAVFRDGRAVIRVALSRFMNEGRDVNYNMVAVANYRIEPAPDGPKLVRQGEIAIEWPLRAPRTVERLVYQAKFRARFETLFRPELFVADVRPRNAPRGFGALRDFVLRSENGWFTVGFRRVQTN